MKPHPFSPFVFLLILFALLQAAPFPPGARAADGDLITTFNPNPNGGVAGSAVQPDGKVVIGGTFTTVGGAARARIARLNADGTADAGFNPSADVQVSSTTVQSDGRVLIGGIFNNINGVARRGLARLNANGSLDAAFNPNVDGLVYSSAPQSDGRIVIGGSFSRVGGVDRDNFARVNADGSFDPSIVPFFTLGVYSMALQEDGRIVVGGDFQFDRIARVNFDGTLDTTFRPNANGRIQAVAAQADGRILIAGTFTSVAGNNASGTPRNRIARLNADGTLDATFNPNVDAEVKCMVLQADGRIIIGGDFTTVGGITRNRLARLNANGTLDAGFNPNPNLRVDVVTLLPNGQILIAGNFTTVGGATRNRLALLANSPATQSLTVPSASRVQWLRGGTTPETTQVTFELSTDAGANWTALGAGTRISGGWELTGLGLPASGSIRARARTAGGQFNGSSGLVEQQASFSGLPSPDIAVYGFANLIADGDTTPNPTDGTDFGTGVAVDGGQVERIFDVYNLGNAPLNLTGNPRVTIGGANAGDFSVTIQPQSPVAPGIAGAAFFWIKFNPSASGLRTAIVSIPNDDPDENPYNFAIAGTGNNDLDPSFFIPDLNVVSSAVALPDGRILVDTIQTAGGISSYGIHRLNADGTRDASFSTVGGPNTVGPLLVQPDGKIVFGGNFFRVGEITRNRIARLNADGSLDLGFDLDVGNSVACLSLQADGRIIVGGNFSTVDGATRNHIARLMPEGTLDVDFNPNANGSVITAAVQSDGKVVIGGGFTTVGGVPRNWVARLNADGTLDAAFNPNANGSVITAAIQADGKILIAGAFTTVGGLPRNGIARLNGDGTLDSSFNPGVVATVSSISVQADGGIVIGGDFTALGGVARNNIARLNPDGSVDLAFNPNANDRIRSTALQADGRVIIGGDFTAVNTVPRNHIARLLNGPATQALTVPSTSRVQWLRGGAAPETTQVSFDLSINGGATWTPLGVGTRISGGWQLTGLALPTSGRVRARARTADGAGSSGLVEQQVAFAGFTAPEITVLRNVTSITDGDTTPSVAEGTDFGVTNVVGGTVTRTFTIRNIGNALLNLPGPTPVTVSGPHAADFIVTQPEALVLGGAETTTFQVTFNPSAGGLRTATLSLASNDADENPFDFALQGYGTVPNLIVTTIGDNGPGSLRHALTNVSPDGTITFAPALSGGTIGLTSGQLVIDRNVNVVGLGAANLTISGNGSSRVFFINAGVNASIAGLTIANGRVTGAVGGPSPTGSGGAIFSQDNFLRVSNCTFTGNSATAGGAIYSGYYAPVGSDLPVTLTVDDCRFEGNHADDDGGGIHIYRSITETGLALIINRTTLHGNTAGTGGGLTIVRAQTVLSSCTLSGNQAGAGAGIYNSWDGILTMTNCTLSGNVATQGGGIYNNQSAVYVRHSTFKDNAAAGPAGGAFHHTFGLQVFSHVLLARNSTSSVYGATSGGIVANEGSNLADDSSAAGFATQVADLKLGLLANNGGPTLTHALLPGSPALNAGTNAAIAGLPFDQRGPGFPRLVGSAVDIGAYELQASPSFDPVPIAGLQGVSDSSVTWADYDNDGRLDLFLTGDTGLQKLSQLWRNTGAGFSLVPIPGLAGVSQGSVAWSDYDNDGRLDFLIMGNAGSENISQLWRNTGTGFVQVPIPGLPAVLYGAVAWADYDCDGRQDFLITGNTGSSSAGSTNMAQLWRNTGAGFVQVPIPGLLDGSLNSVAWGDYNNDGRPDFLITGAVDTDSAESQLWRNTGSGFVQVSIPGLPGVYGGVVTWGDYDNDGRLDFLLTGFTGTTPVSQVWRNTGSGFVNTTPVGLPQVYQGGAAWGDYDNDGRLDILITGGGAGADLAQIWRNTGTTFAKVTDQTLPGARFGEVAWADYNNDGRLDLFLSGLTTGLWKNNSPAINTAPSAPTALASQVHGGSSVTLRWNPATDAQTPSAGLSYNLVLGTSANAVDAASPNASVPDGFRRVVRLGAVNGAAAGPLTYTFTNLPPAPQYFWSVQAIDSAFAGGPFAASQSFGIATLQITVANTNDAGPGSLRQAIADISADGTIDFAPDLNGRTIGLTSGELVIDKHLTISGPGADKLRLSGNGLSRVIRVASNAVPHVVTIADLTIANGNGMGGGALGAFRIGGGIMNDNGSLTIDRCTLSDNSASSGGGIHNWGQSGWASLTVRSSTFSGNAGDGGGIFNAGAFGTARLHVENSTFSGNAGTFNGGGAIWNEEGILTLTGSTLTGNRAISTNGLAGGLAARGTEHLANSIIMGNFSVRTGTEDNVNWGGVDSARACLIGPPTGASLPLSSVLNTNLAYNGGPTRTHALVRGSPAIDAGPGYLPNAWQITDASGVAGSLNFSNTLSAAQKIAATNSGWHFTVISRQIQGSGGSGPAQFMTYGHGDRRFIVGWDLDASGRLTARFYGAGGTFSGVATNLTGPGEGSSAYHQHELIYSPATRTATYLLDGTPVYTWTGLAPNSDYNGQALFGAGANGGRGGMNFHRVQFAITGQGTVSEYSAGYQGNPAIAPDPASQGWTRTWSVPANTDVTNAPVSPDAVALPPGVLDAIGLLYDQRGFGFDRIGNGRIDIGAYEVQQPKVTQAGKVPQGFAVSFKGEPNETLNIEWNADARNVGWQPLTTGTTDASGSVQVIDSTPSAPRRFYRSVRP